MAVVIAALFDSIRFIFFTYLLKTGLARNPCLLCSSPLGRSVFIARSSFSLWDSGYHVGSTDACIVPELSSQAAERLLLCSGPYTVASFFHLA